ncbi:MAG: pyruvate carboxylase subunit A [Ignavibacteriae bacterium]|nr:pyruvate carboxylase subunit A [Ignavibacteriota bacterium]
MLCSKKILIVNRGEIAVRIIKACRELKIISAVLYTDADKNSLHVRAADQAYYIGKSPANESYLNISKIIETAKIINADAIHPGYGFLSENSKFIKEVESAGITFIGPSSKSVEMMGEKTSARRLMKENNVPIVPGTTNPIDTPEEALIIAEEIGYPIMIKASAGGGGKGMRKVYNKSELVSSFERAKNEALKSFGNFDVYIEKLIENPKHIEVQILGDKFGNYVHLFERECSVQRRHQKIIEEAPSSFVDEYTREKITNAAINAAKACNYYNAGTIEFLMDKNKNFYFLEMNTRLQVEHPVTEMITGIDLVKEQIRIAAGNKISISQDEIVIKGHAIECRIYAEDTINNFAPSTGIIKHHRLPSGPGIRVDRGIDLKSEVTVYYDPLLSKVISFGNNRNESIERMLRALGEYQIVGVVTNIELCRWILQRESFTSGNFDINFIENELFPLLPESWKSDVSENYENVISILAAILKSKEIELAPRKNCGSQSNKWSELQYE